MTLKDPSDRPVTNLRVSLTPSCNLRCFYCHAEGERAPVSLITTDQIAGILAIGEKFGVRSVKFTGGEPLLRPDLAEIIRSVPDSMEASITTNGTLLSGWAARLHEAGLSRVNISIDSLSRETYRTITGCDLLPDVLEGIEAALDAGLTPVKLNMVVLEGINDNEVDDFLGYIRGRRDLVLQLIELIDVNNCPYHSDLTDLENRLSRTSDRIITRRMHHRRKYCLDGAEVEVVRPLHNTEFCAFCNRLRVTSDGAFKPCLLRQDNHVPIGQATGAGLEALFLEAVRRRRPFYT